MLPGDDAGYPTRAAHVDRLFKELDGREVQVGAARWVSIVSGIHLDGNTAWVQLALDGSPRGEVLLHLSESVTMDETLTALREWLSRLPCCRPAVVDVLSCPLSPEPKGSLLD